MPVQGHAKSSCFCWLNAHLGRVLLLSQSTPSLVMQARQAPIVPWRNKTLFFVSYLRSLIAVACRKRMISWGRFCSWSPTRDGNLSTSTGKNYLKRIHQRCSDILVHFETVFFFFTKQQNRIHIICMAAKERDQQPLNDIFLLFFFFW
jgi:hypothetical protein